MSEQKKEALIGKIEDSKKITEPETEWIKEQYLAYLKRTGAQSAGTQANYLQAIAKILEETKTEITKIQDLETEELGQLNKEVADSIQDSKYRHSEGENCQRRKRHQWTAWKKALETQGINTAKHKDHIPKVQFTSSGKVERQADTKPEDLPTPSQMKEFVKVLGEISGETVKLRNQALALLLWDKGPRIGEALNLKIGDVSVNGTKVEIDFTGNKGSKDRPGNMLQGRKTFKDYIESHPKKDDPEAYLFPKLKTQEFYSELSKKPLRRRIHKARRVGDFEFKTEGEPFHIFRKAMVTYHIVNGWATWEEIATWHGKKDDGTKPDYVKMATSDVDASVAEKMGVDEEIETDEENRMIGPPLTPVNCVECDRLNRCYSDVCAYCGTELPESEMPKGEDFDEEEKDREKMKGEWQTMRKTAKKLGLDVE